MNFENIHELANNDGLRTSDTGPLNIYSQAFENRERFLLIENGNESNEISELNSLFG